MPARCPTPRNYTEARALAMRAEAFASLRDAPPAVRAAGSEARTLSAAFFGARESEKPRLAEAIRDHVQRVLAWVEEASDPLRIVEEASESCEFILCNGIRVGNYVATLASADCSTRWNLYRIARVNGEEVETYIATVDARTAMDAIKQARGAHAETSETRGLVNR